MFKLLEHEDNTLTNEAIEELSKFNCMSYKLWKEFFQKVADLRKNKGSALDFNEISTIFADTRLGQKNSPNQTSDLNSRIHEYGHAFIQDLINLCNRPLVETRIISVYRRGEYAGVNYVTPVSTKEDHSSIISLLSFIVPMLGGQTVESLYHNNIFTAANSDINMIKNKFAFFASNGLLGKSYLSQTKDFASLNTETLILFTEIIKDANKAIRDAYVAVGGKDAFDLVDTYMLDNYKGEVIGTKAKTLVTDAIGEEKMIAASQEIKKFLVKWQEILQPTQD